MKKYLLWLLLTGVMGCSGSAKPEPGEPAGPAAAPQVPPPANAVSAGPGPAQTVRQFIGWYAAHREELEVMSFILNRDGQDSTKFYAVDFPGTEAWLAKVAGSGRVAPAFLASRRAYFRSQDDSLRKYPQNEDTPQGFEYDFIMLSRDADSKVEDLQAGTFTVARQHGPRATVQVRGRRHDNWQEGLDFELAQAANGQWLITSIFNRSTNL